MGAGNSRNNRDNRDRGLGNSSNETSVISSKMGWVTWLSQYYTESLRYYTNIYNQLSLGFMVDPKETRVQIQSRMNCTSAARSGLGIRYTNPKTPQVPVPSIVDVIPQGINTTKMESSSGKCYHVIEDCGVRGSIRIPLRGQLGFELGLYWQMLVARDWTDRTLLSGTGKGFLTESSLQEQTIGYAEWFSVERNPSCSTASQASTVCDGSCLRRSEQFPFSEQTIQWYCGELHSHKRSLFYRIHPTVQPNRKDGDPTSFREAVLDGLSFGRTVVDLLDSTPSDTVVSRDWRSHHDAEIGCSLRQPIAVVEQWFLPP